MRGGGGSGSVLRAVLGGFAAPDPVLPPPVIPGDAGGGGAGRASIGAVRLCVNKR